MLRSKVKGFGLSAAAFAATLSGAMYSPVSEAFQTQPFTVPETCDYGRQRYDFSLDELKIKFKLSLDYGTIDTEIPDYSNGLEKLINKAVDSLDYLRVEIPKHVLRGNTFRAKGNLFDILSYVRFHNSELGYVGKDKSNLEANAYYHMSFPNTHGVGMVWITRGDAKECSMESIYVQERPEIFGHSFSTGTGLLTLDLDYAVDNWSQAYMDSNTNVRFSVNLRGDTFGNSETHTFTSSQTSGNRVMQINPSTGGGIYSVRVTVHDGNFSTTKDLGNVYVYGPSTPPCPNCQPL